MPRSLTLSTKQVLSSFAGNQSACRPGSTSTKSCGDPSRRDAIISAGGDWFYEIFTCPKPVVIACTGHAVAGGVVFLLVAIHVLAALAQDRFQRGTYRSADAEVRHLPHPIPVTPADGRIDPARRYVRFRTMRCGQACSTRSLMVTQVRSSTPPSRAQQNWPLGLPMLTRRPNLPPASTSLIGSRLRPACRWANPVG